MFLKRRISREPVRVIDNLLASYEMLSNKTTFSLAKNKSSEDVSPKQAKTTKPKRMIDPFAREAQASVIEP